MNNVFSKILVRTLSINFKTNVGTMSQKSILSFFQKQSPTASTTLVASASSKASTPVPKSEESSVKKNASSKLSKFVAKSEESSTVNASSKDSSPVAKGDESSPVKKNTSSEASTPVPKSEESSVKKNASSKLSKLAAKSEESSVKKNISSKLSKFAAKSEESSTVNASSKASSPVAKGDESSPVKKNTSSEASTPAAKSEESSPVKKNVSPKAFSPVLENNESSPVKKNVSSKASTPVAESDESSPVKKNNVSSEIDEKITTTKTKKKRKRINVGSDSEEDCKEDVKVAKEDVVKNGEKEVEEEIKAEPKKEIKTLSFLGSKKRSNKTPKKPAAKKQKANENKDTNNKTPAKTEIKSEEETKKTKTAKSDEETPVDKKPNSEENKPVKKTSGNSFFISKTSSENDTILEYFPDKSNYHPIEDAPWKREERVPYLALAKTLKKIEETSSRLKIVEILSNYFRSVIVLSEDDFLPSVYLCLGQLAPAYEGLELGIADMYLKKAIAECTGRTVPNITADLASIGDLGIIAEQSRSNQRYMHRPAPLTVQSVFNQLTNIAKISGNQAMTKKVDKIKALYVACRDCEIRFVTRSLSGKMRIGLAEQSVLQAIAVACTTTPPNQTYPPEIFNAAKGISAEEFKKKVDEESSVLKATFCECPNYDKIIPVILKKGIRALPEECKITPGLPVKPMLAQPTTGAHAVLEKFEGMKFTCEWKYDGERAQIHLMEDGRMKIYSRNQEDHTSKYPDIISNISQIYKPEEVKSFILDTEAVAWDREQKKIMPFQVLSTRKRKDAAESEIKVSVCVFMFDLLFFNGESLIQKPLIERRELLKKNFVEVEGKFRYVISLDTSTMEEVQECLEESVKGNCEGLMVKTLETEATYEINKRSRNWLKLKKDYLEGVGDTLDLVVIGGYTGKGKRTGTYGGFLLASYDEENEEYQAICKIGTGFTDEILAQHTEFLKKHVIEDAKPYYRCDPSIKPDYWFDAVQVWEVKCADLSLSPIYSAAVGLCDPEKGISLRFPRFLRIREDKTVEQATSAQQVAELYRNQDQIKNQGTTSTFNEEDF